MGPFGFGEIIFLFFIALVIFGPKKLPELGKTLGKGLREFRRATDDLKSNWEEHVRDAESPVQDLKQTFSEVKKDVEEATSLPSVGLDDLNPDNPSLEGTPATATPEETKPDASAN
jgi:TatA/E family protein of Tat protein translocase